MSRAMTGIRPTGDLTVGNYAGAMVPLVELQDTYDGSVSAFVADYHALTDQSPDVIKEHRFNIVRAVMAAGVDPNKVNLYTQSHVIAPTMDVEWLLSTVVNHGRATRVPTLKEKLGKRDTEDVDVANMALIRYPLLMAADIVVQDADHVPVGQDQYSHIELTRDAVQAFNHRYGAGEAVLTMPDAWEDTGVKIFSLTGGDKMSKSEPKGALLLHDKPDDAASKIRRAVTGNPGEDSPQIENYILLCERIGASAEEVEELRGIYAAHRAGSLVMGQFKAVMTDAVVSFLREYQDRFNNTTDADVQAALKRGNTVALRRANDVARRAKSAMGFM